MKNMIKDFKEFLMQGNVIDMAIGVVVGGAFTSIVNNIVSGFITPLVGLAIKFLTGSKNAEFSGLNLHILGVQLNFGNILSAVITFLITALVVFFILKTITKAKNLLPIEIEDKEEEVELTLTESTLKDIQETLQKQNEMIEMLMKDREGQTQEVKQEN